MQLEKELERENADWRIREGGTGAELVRKVELERLLPHLSAFIAHGKLADIVFLRGRFEAVDANGCSGSQAPLLDAILTALDAVDSDNPPTKRCWAPTRYSASEFP